MKPRRTLTSPAPRTDNKPLPVSVKLILFIAMIAVPGIIVSNFIQPSSLPDQDGGTTLERNVRHELQQEEIDRARASSEALERIKQSQ